MNRSIVITGTGRSGTNRLLDMLDQHPQTLCRNEPHALDTAIGRLPAPLHTDTPPPDFAARWRAAMAEVPGHQSLRDRLQTEGKACFTTRGRAMTALMRRRRLRHLTGRRGDEWAIPRGWMRADAAVVPVIKILSRSQWLIAVHDHDPGQRVIHTVRNPRNYLNSWYKRLVMSPLGGGPEQIYGQVRDLAAPILARAGLPALPTQYSLPALLQGELTLWRSVNDSLFTALRHSPRYLMLRYEDISRDPLGCAQTAFDHAGLVLDDQTRARLGAQGNSLFEKSPIPDLDRDLVDAAIAATLGDAAIAASYLPAPGPGPAAAPRPDRREAAS